MNTNAKTIRHGQGIIQIDANYIEPGIACVYLIRENDKLALIETGTLHTVPHILQVIQSIGLTPNDLSWVIPTHVHLDHAAGAGHIMQHCPNSKLVIHPLGARHMINPKKLQDSTMEVYGKKKYAELYGDLVPIDPTRIIKAPDQFSVDFEGRILQFLDTPGHARHHFCVYDKGSDSIFTGDTFGLSYRFFDSSHDNNFVFATTTPNHFEPEQLKSSILRLAKMNPDRMFLTHYGSIAPSDSNVRQLLKSIDAFVTIAKKEMYPHEGRQERIEEKLIEWLVSEITTDEFFLVSAKAMNRLKEDAYLNAQGLNFWLQGLEKSKAS